MSGRRRAPAKGGPPTTGGGAGAGSTISRSAIRVPTVQPGRRALEDAVGREGRGHHPVAVHHVGVLVHGDVMLAESTEMGEYIDGAFPGPALRPENPAERWRMRWWGKFLDGYFGPSLSMIGWSIFVGPSVRSEEVV